jgi:hypothetical protein
MQIADELAAAFERRDADGFYGALTAMVQQVRDAEPAPEELQAAVERLLPVLASVPLGVGGDLAGIVGSMAGLAVDPAVVLPVLVERGIEAAGKAREFAEAYGEDLPDPDDPEQIPHALEHGARDLVEGWFSAGQWLQPVLYLMQRQGIRRVLPRREALIAAVEPLTEEIGVAHWLYGLLLVVDDERLVVLDRGTGSGFEVTIGGVGDNFQLHTLLAANLIGPGLLPGEPPTPAMVAAATDGELAPEGGLVGQFNLVDAYGKWIWNEGRPADIPLLEGVRVVVLDPSPYERHWNAGRAYPLMTPTVTVDRTLTTAEAAAWFTKVAPEGAGSGS